MIDALKAAACAIVGGLAGFVLAGAFIVVWVKYAPHPQHRVCADSTYRCEARR